MMSFINALYSWLKNFIVRWVRPIKKSDHAFENLIIQEHLADRLDALKIGVSLHNGADGAVYGLRRNIHRIEKGLTANPRRDVFAENYILETVRQFAEAVKSPKGFETSFAWSRTSLDSYFRCCRHTPIIAQAWGEYQSISWSDADACMHMAYPASQRERSDITYDELLALAKRRRSIRIYEDRPVPEELIRKALALALLSPSACNRQAFRFRVISNKGLVGEVAELAGGIAGYHVPMLIVVTGLYRAYAEPRDLDAIQIDASMALMSFMYALETLGLSSVCVNWPRITKRDHAIRELLTLDPDEVTIFMVGIGYPCPTGPVLASSRTDLDQVLVFQSGRSLCRDQS